MKRIFFILVIIFFWAGNALANGATLGGSYNGSINQAGLSSPLFRPIGAYDIGAYQYTTSTGNILLWVHP